MDCYIIISNITVRILKPRLSKSDIKKSVIMSAIQYLYDRKYLLIIIVYYYYNIINSPF